MIRRILNLFVVALIVLGGLALSLYINFLITPSAHMNVVENGKVFEIQGYTIYNTFEERGDGLYTGYISVSCRQEEPTGWRSLHGVPLEELGERFFFQQVKIWNNTLYYRIDGKWYGIPDTCN